MTASNKQYEYFAFISYKREDEKWAKWLQHKLEYYKIPAAIRKQHPKLPKRIRPVFKDTTNLDLGTLSKKIQEGLDASKYLIVICSPHSANSVWVNKEVQSFIDGGREEYIIPFIIGGSPNANDAEKECFPPCLRQLTGDKELLAANINELGRDAAVIKVVAHMFALRFDTLWQRFQRARRRRLLMMAIFSVLMLAMVVLMGVLYVDRNNAYESLAESNQRLEKAYEDLKLSKDSIQIGNHKLSLAYDSIRSGNRLLEISNKDLELRTEELTKSNYYLQRERIRLLAEEATSLFKNNEVLKAYRKIKPFLRTSNNRVPLEPTVTALLNDIAIYLSSEDYRIVDVLPDMGDILQDEYYFSRDGNWYAYGEEGRYLLYNFKTQEIMQLPGSWWGTYDFSFNNNNDELLYCSYGDVHLWDLNHNKELPIEDLPKGDLDEVGEFVRKYVNENDFQEIHFFESDDNDSLGNLDSSNTASNHSYNIDNYPWINSYIRDNDISLLAVHKDGTVFVGKNQDNKIGLYSEDTIFGLEYSFRSDEDSSWLTPYYEFLPSGKDLIVNTNFLTNRHINYIAPKTRTYSETVNDNKINKPHIKYKGHTWQLLDSKGHCQLYTLSDTSDEDSYDSMAGELLLKVGGHVTEFTPFLGWSIGNGQSSLAHAYILDDDNILCLADQGPHMVYKISTKERRYFDENSLDLWVLGHPSVFVIGCKMLNDDTMVDVRGGGVITYYDVPTGHILAEYAVPVELVRETSGFSRVAFLTDKEMLLMGDEDSKSFKITIPSIEQRNEYIIKELDKFWD